MPITTIWQWLRDGIEISGAADPNYLLVSSDSNTEVSVRQSASNADGIDSAAPLNLTIQALPSSESFVISNLAASDQTVDGVVDVTYAIDIESAVIGIVSTDAAGDDCCDT